MYPSSPLDGPPAPATPAEPPAPAAGAPDPPRRPPRATGLVLLLLAVLPLSLVGAASLLAGALVTQVALVMVTLAWARRSGFRTAPLLRLAAPPQGALRLGAGVGVASILAGGGLHVLTRAVLPERLLEAFDVNQALLDAGWSRPVLIAVASILPAACEELAFRGGLLSALAAGRSPTRAIGLSALAFAGFHLDPVRFPAVLLLGVAFGWLAWRTGSLWPSMLAHAVNNGTAVLGLLVAGQGDPAERTEQLPWTDGAVMVAAGAVLFALLAWAARRWLPPAPAPSSFLVPRPARSGSAGGGGDRPPAATTAGAAPSPSGIDPP